MQEDGHRIWGWLLYRCTYASDEQWVSFLERLWYYIEATLAFHNGQDLKHSLDLRVVEDRTVLDQAVPSTVHQWASTAARLEQDRPATRAQKYRYCLHVDQTALESVLNGPDPSGDNHGGGFVNFILLNPSADDLTGVSPDLSSNWMKIAYADLIARWYTLLRPEGVWETEYRRPPQVRRP